MNPRTVDKNALRRDGSAYDPFSYRSAVGVKPGEFLAGVSVSSYSCETKAYRPIKAGGCLPAATSWWVALQSHEASA